jgi:hypothetical protein
VQTTCAPRDSLVIANTSSGKRFGPLATYLVSGRSGTETDRVAWTAGRNLGTDDAELAAPLMQATARQSALVQVPVYHLTVSFDHQDRVSPEQMQRVADRVLHDLGLSKHQALMVAHKDREHAHVHVMVNRVHPDTGVAWERWQDRPTIERALREEERTLGLREVAGRLHQVDGREIPERAALAPGERRQAERTADPAFVDRVRDVLPELRAARSWEDLAARLAERGLRVEGKGQGLVFTDGEHEVKASRIGRDLSLRRLEERFGVPYPNREQLNGAPVRAQAELSPAAAELDTLAREHERVSALRRVSYELDLEGSRLHARSHGFDDAVRAIARTSHDVDRALRLVYRDPEAARSQMRDMAVATDPAQVELLLRREPERFGALRTVEESRAFGLVTAQDDSKARASAHILAREWTSLATAERQASTRAVEYLRTAEQHFDKMLAQVYRDPTAARHAIDLAHANAGREETLRMLSQSPDRLGAVRTPGTPPEVARLDWQTLADSARTAFDARHITSSELAKAHVDRAIANNGERKRDVRHAIESAPSAELLERAIGRAVDRLEPAELTQLRRVLTAPQAAIVFKAHQTMRDIVLGREEGIER